MPKMIDQMLEKLNWELEQSADNYEGLLRQATIHEMIYHALIIKAVKRGPDATDG